MSDLNPVEVYAEKPFELDGVPTVIEYIDHRGNGVFDDYLNGIIWPTERLATTLLYSAGRVVNLPNDLTRRVFATSASAVVDSMFYSSLPDEEIAARCRAELVGNADEFAPVPAMTHPHDGREIVERIFEIEAGHNPGLVDLVTSVELAFTPSFDQLVEGTGPGIQQFEQISQAARLGVGYGAAVLHNAWEAAITSYATMPDDPGMQL